jgi:hypothetical protein
MTLDYRWYKKELEFLRTLSQGTMPITKMCKDDDEYDAFQEVKKGMRGLKTISFEKEKTND